MLMSTIVVYCDCVAEISESVFFFPVKTKLAFVVFSMLTLELITLLVFMRVF